MWWVLLWIFLGFFALFLGIVCFILFLPACAKSSFTVDEADVSGEFEVVLGAPWLFRLDYSSRNKTYSVSHVGKFWPWKKKEKRPEDRENERFPSEEGEAHGADRTQEPGPYTTFKSHAPTPDWNDTNKSFRQAPEEQQRTSAIQPSDAFRTPPPEDRFFQERDANEPEKLPSSADGTSGVGAEDEPVEKPSDETHSYVDVDVPLPNTNFSEGKEPEDREYEPRYPSLSDERYHDGTGFEKSNETDQDPQGHGRGRKRRWRPFGMFRDRYTVIRRIDPKILAFRLVRRLSLWTGFAGWLGRVGLSFFRLIAWKELRLHVTLGIQDPAVMGRIYGWWIAASHGLALPEQRNLSLALEPRFLKEQFAMSGSIRCCTSASRLVRPAFLMLFLFPYGRVLGALWDITNPKKNEKLLAEEGER